MAITLEEAAVAAAHDGNFPHPPRPNFMLRFEVEIKFYFLKNQFETVSTLLSD